jgi:hypothetical protein
VGSWSSAASTFALTASVASGCGPARDAASAELDEICGAASPLQLLALDEPDFVTASAHRVARESRNDCYGHAPAQLASVAGNAG